jgi:hypothetical protein
MKSAKVPRFGMVLCQSSGSRPLLIFRLLVFSMLVIVRTTATLLRLAFIYILALLDSELQALLKYRKWSTFLPILIFSVRLADLLG